MHLPALYNHLKSEISEKDIQRPVKVEGGNESEAFLEVLRNLDPGMRFFLPKAIERGPK
jgi:hypothetical protein